MPPPKTLHITFDTLGSVVGAIAYPFDTLGSVVGAI